MYIVGQKPVLGKLPRDIVREPYNIPMPAGLWPSNEGVGGLVNDLSGNNHNSTLVGDVIWVPGKFGHCLDLLGVEDYVNIPSPASDYIKSEGTILIWFNPDWSSGDSTGHALWGTSNNMAAAGSPFLRAEHFSNNNWYIGWYNGVEDRVIISSAMMSVIAGSWYQLAFTWNDAANVERVYLNAVEKGSVVDSVSTFSPAGFFGLGINHTDWNAAGYNEYDGQWGATMIFDRALTAQQIAQLYQNPFPWFKRDPIGLWVAATAPPIGAPGAMTLNTGYWGQVV